MHHIYENNKHLGLFFRRGSFTILNNISGFDANVG